MLPQAILHDAKVRWFFLLPLSVLLGSCISPTVKPSKQSTLLVTPTDAHSIKLENFSDQLTIEQTTHWKKAPPDNYNLWLKQNNHADQVNRYYNYLIRHDATRAAPMFELLKSARDWQRCGREPYAVPSSELWDNLLPTLKVMQTLQDEKILSNIEVTSVYRDAELNQCANGAPGSKHVHNAALDFRIGSENPSIGELENIARTKNELCQFWNKHGARLNMGLGLYASGQIHIDTQGFRTWGPDHTRNTSICPS